MYFFIQYSIFITQNKHRRKGHENPCGGLTHNVSAMLGSLKLNYYQIIIQLVVDRIIEETLLCVLLVRFKIVTCSILYVFVNLTRFVSTLHKLTIILQHFMLLVG